jgi:hypothetical protein
MMMKIRHNKYCSIDNSELKRLLYHETEVMIETIIIFRTIKRTNSPGGRKRGTNRKE